MPWDGSDAVVQVLPWSELEFGAVAKASQPEVIMLDQMIAMLFESTTWTKKMLYQRNGRVVRRCMYAALNTVDHGSADWVSPGHMVFETHAAMCIHRRIVQKLHPILSRLAFRRVERAGIVFNDCSTTKHKDMMAFLLDVRESFV